MFTKLTASTASIFRYFGRPENCRRGMGMDRLHVCEKIRNSHIWGLPHAARSFRGEVSSCWSSRTWASNGHISRGSSIAVFGFCKQCGECTDEILHHHLKGAILSCNDSSRLRRSFRAESMAFATTQLHARTSPSRSVRPSVQGIQRRSLRMRNHLPVQLFGHLPRKVQRDVNHLPRIQRREIRFRARTAQ